jgi:anthranilate phosphoribosyltransferase
VDTCESERPEKTLDSAARRLESKDATVRAARIAGRARRATDEATMRDVLDKLTLGHRLSRAETERVFAAMLGGEMTEAQIAAALTAWRLTGEGVDELLAGARALRAKAVGVTLPTGVRPLADNCGTGGDGSGTFNISTAAAIVAAAAGVHVAKHGNRSVSSQCGSADLLFAAGFPATLAPQAAAQLLAELGFTFFFAPTFHPLMKTVGPVRAALGFRTVFNLLGPLANPITPELQLVGVGSQKYLTPVAEALSKLGVSRALVVHARDGLDEISPAAPTDCWLVEGSQMISLVIDPLAQGVKLELKDVAGGDPAHNLALLRDMLDGKAPGVAAAVALNAGALLWLAGRSGDHGAGFALAQKLIADGSAKDFFGRWIARAQALA